MLALGVLARGGRLPARPDQGHGQLVVRAGDRRHRPRHAGRGQGGAARGLRPSPPPCATAAGLATPAGRVVPAGPSGGSWPVRMGSRGWPMPVLEVDGGLRGLRGGRGARRRVAVGRAGGGDRAHRSERGRQDHAVQRRQRPAGAQVRPDRHRRPRRHQSRAGRPGPAGAVPHLPAARAVHLAVGAGQHPGGRRDPQHLGAAGPDRRQAPRPTG